ncbi:MAG: MATE family efflux transporter [Rhodobacteraceae bacterium]|nr:MATE family efflux transporter [Paracoccaceae bacterium]
MSALMSYPGHAKAVAVLGLPLIGGHLAQYAINLTDTVMLGWYGVEALAAVTLAGSFFFMIFLLGSGFSFAVMPMVAAFVAKEDEISIRRVTRMGLWLSLGFALLVMPLMTWSGDILLLLGQNEAVAGRAGRYLQVAGWGLIPALLVMVLKSYLAALERTQIVLWITVLAALINGFANYALIFGNWGAPEMGIMGAAVASVLSNMLSLVAIAVYVSLVEPEHAMFQRFWRPDWEMLGRVFRLGLPAGLTTMSEVGLFAASAMMMGWLGTIPLAAHGIVISVAGATFMVHLGLSNVATIRAGHAFGRQDRVHMARGAVVAIGLSGLMAFATILLFVLAPVPIMSLFMDAANPARADILAVGIGLFAVAALFQVVDGAQAIAIGLLRGVQDTGVPMVMAGLSYWAVGIPTSYLLGFVFGFGGIGIWLGLSAGLALAGILLMLRFWRGAITRVGRVEGQDD